MRARLRPDHLRFLLERQPMLIAAGAMLDEEGLAIGGIIILETEEASVAEAFAAEDPYAVGGLFESVNVVRWRKSFVAGVSYLALPVEQ